MISLVYSLPFNIVGYLKHLIGRLDRFTVGLIGSLGRNHINHLVYHTDIGHFQKALVNCAQSILAGNARRFIAG